MARRFRQVRSIEEMMTSVELENILRGLGEQILASAKSDPNEAYVESLELQAFRSRGKRGARRVVVQVGAVPGLGNAVEAKRGTLARALGSVGA